MTAAAFPASIAAALDSFTIPALPRDFAERLVERTLARDAVAASLPETPRRRSSAWSRAGRIVASVATLGFVTAAAAAGGVFGEPLYVPGITEAMQKANVITAPAPKTHAQAIAKIAAKPVPAPVPVSGQARAKAALDELRKDPAFESMRPRDKMKAAVRETRALVKSGAVTRPEARAALKQVAQERIAELPPERQQAIKDRMEKIRERRAAKRDLRQQRRAENPPAGAE